MKFAFLSPKGPWLLVLAAFVLFACLVAAQTTPSIAAWPYWQAVNLTAQVVVLAFLVLLVFHAVKVDVSIEPGTGSNSCNSLAASHANGCLANSLQLHRQNLELKAMQHVVVAAVLNGNKQAGKLARAAIDQLLGVGSLEYAKASLDEPAKRVAAHWQELAAQQACTCTGNQACSNCPPQRFGAVKTPPAADDTEALIQAKGKTAPRITPADIEANIVSEVYFVAADALRFSYLTSDPKSREDRLKKNSICDSLSGRSYCGACIDIDSSTEIPAPTKLLTFCVLVLRNGFTVTGESACASPENFDAEIGRKIARENAVNKIWPLMGYEMRTKLASATT